MNNKFPHCFQHRAKQLLAGSLFLVSSALMGTPVQAGEVKPTTNGTYFYGETTQVDQIGQGYVVFTQKNGKVVGALYHPRSDFNCFSGTIKEGELDIVAIELNDRPVNLQIPLSGLYSIPTMSEVGEQTLAACQQEIARRESRNPTASRQTQIQPAN